MSNNLKKPRLFYGYFIVAACTLIMMFTWGAIYIFGIFFEPLLQEFGWSRSLISGALSISLLITGILNLYIGKISDKYDPRPIMIAAGLLIGAGFFLISQVHTIWQFYLIYVVMISAGMSATFAPVMAIIARWFVNRRALMTTIAVAGYSLGTAVLPQIATYSIDAYGWRNSYIILGITVLIVVVVASLFLRLNPEKMGLKPYGHNDEKNSVQNIQIQGSTLKEALHTRQFWIIGISTMFLWFCYTHIMVNSVIYMTDLGISDISATNMLSLIGLTNGVAVLGLGFMADKYGNWKLLFGCMLIFALALTVFPFAKSERSFYAIAVLVGLAFCGSPILMMIIPAEIFGLKTIGLLIAVFNFCSTIGQFLSPVLTSYIFDVTGTYNIVFIICILLSLIMLTSVLFLRSKGVESNKITMVQKP